MHKGDPVNNNRHGSPSRHHASHVRDDSKPVNTFFYGRSGRKFKFLSPHTKRIATTNSKLHNNTGTLRRRYLPSHHRRTIRKHQAPPCFINKPHKLQRCWSPHSNRAGRVEKTFPPRLLRYRDGHVSHHCHHAHHEGTHSHIALLPQSSLLIFTLDAMLVLHRFAVSSEPTTFTVHLLGSRRSIHRNNLSTQVLTIALCVTLAETLQTTLNLRSSTPTLPCAAHAAHNKRPSTFPEHRSWPSIHSIESSSRLPSHEFVPQSKERGIKTRLPIKFLL